MLSVENLLRKQWRRAYARFHCRTASPLEVERAEQIFYLNYLREGMIVFDVGANIGELTLLFSRFVGTGDVHAFEPGSECFARLNAVCRAANLRNVHLNQCALADAEGERALYVYDDTHLGWNSLAQRPLQNYGIEVRPPVIEKISAMTLDAYCAARGVERIDLLKIDVEGAELDVMRGAEKMLRERRIACIAFEFGQATFDMGHTPGEIAGFLKNLNYRVSNVVARDPVFPGGRDVRTAQFSMHIGRPK
jgi:FkbM family methyltransferase